MSQLAGLGDLCEDFHCNVVIELCKCDGIWQFYFIFSSFSFNGFHRALSSIAF